MPFARSFLLERNTMRTPLVSVLVPTYRRPRLLSRTLRSILAQSQNDFQILVFDNASGDETSSVVQNFTEKDRRVIYNVNELNIGAIANFARAFSAVNTPYFCLVSDDDILLPRCLELALHGLNNHPRAMGWGGVVINAGDQCARAYEPDPLWPIGYADPITACLRICSNSRPSTSGFVFRREVISDVFTAPASDFVISDVGWILHAAGRGGIGFHRKPSAVFYRHDGSICSIAEASAKRTFQLYWPSVLYLVDIIKKLNLPATTKSECIKLLRIHYGLIPLQLAREKAMCGNEFEIAQDIANILCTEFSCCDGINAQSQYEWFPKIVNKVKRRWNLCRHHPSQIAKRHALRNLFNIADIYLKRYADI